MPDLTGAQWLAAVLAVFGGGLVIGVGGFGSSLIAAPVLIWVLEPTAMVVTNLSLAILTRIPIIVRDRGRVRQPLTRQLVVGGLLGLPLGVALLSMLSSHGAKLFLSALVVVFGMPYLLIPDRIAPITSARSIWSTLIGLVSGVLTTSSSLSGPPVVLWLSNQRLPKHAFRVTTSVVGTVLNIAGIVLLIATGKVALSSLALPVVLLPAAAIGALLGDQLLGRLSEVVFTKGTACLVIFAGLTGLTLALR